jgi:hypothetical protein
MQHHESPTARALKLTVHMIAVLFGKLSDGKPSTLRALVSRGLAVKDASGVYTLTDAGRDAVDKIDGEVLGESAPISAAEDGPYILLTPPITVELPSGESLDVPAVEVEDESNVVPLPVERRTVRARDVKAGQTIGLADGREVLVTSVRWVGDQVTITGACPGWVEVSTPAIALFTLINDGSLFDLAC